MADQTKDGVEVLVLSDRSGNLYAIPRRTLEEHRVSGNQRGQIEAILGSDVTGFAWRENAPQTSGATTQAPAPVALSLEPDAQAEAMQIGLNDPVLFGRFVFVPSIVFNLVAEP
jgi:hypothetical protein